MAETQPLIVDPTQADYALQIMPRPALCSSEHLGWNDISIQKHQQPAWETPEFSMIRHTLLIHNYDAKVQSERWIDGRQLQNKVWGRNNIVLVPAMVLHKANWSQEGNFCVLFLEPDCLNRIAYESTHGEQIELIPHAATEDPFISEISWSLAAELETNQLKGKLFVESLTTALSIHLLRHYSTYQKPLHQGVEGLSQRQLRQAADYIHAYLAEDLTVAMVANQLQMSQYYFSRLFKLSMGVPPYQYIMQQRIEQAKFLLRTTSLLGSVIATQVGFSTHNQFISQFRRFMGTTPSRYRKKL